MLEFYDDYLDCREERRRYNSQDDEQEASEYWIEVRTEKLQNKCSADDIEEHLLDSLLPTEMAEIALCSRPSEYDRLRIGEIIYAAIERHFRAQAMREWREPK